MTAIPQQVLDAQKAALEKIVAVQGSMFNGFEKLVDLNLKVMKATMEEATQVSHQAIGIKDAQDALSLSSSVVQPSAEKAMAYGKHVYDIVAQVQSEIAKLSEGQLAETQKRVAEAVEQFSRNAPVGSESAVAMLKSSLAQVNQAYDSMTKAAKQAADVAEKNLSAAANATFKAASDAADAAKNVSRGRRAA